MYLIFDTETTGLPKNWNAPITDFDNWPRLVQLAFSYYDKDGNELEKGNLLIKPEGFKIPIEATKIHGITTDIALNEGRDLRKVLEEFLPFLEETEFLVAHNIAYDENIMGAEYLRKRIENIIPSIKKICTMKQSTEYCALPGSDGYKWPRLSQLYRQLFGEDFEGAHDAYADMQATARCFWELKKKGVIDENI